MSSPDDLLAIEDLVARYSRGDRRLSIVRVLDYMAWQAFHDPWEEVPPAPPAPPKDHPFLGEIARGTESRAPDIRRHWLRKVLVHFRRAGEKAQEAGL